MDRLPRLEDVPPAPGESSDEVRAAATGRPGSQATLPLDSLVFLLVGGPLATILCWDLRADLVIALTAARTSGTVQFRYEAGGSVWPGEGNSRRARAPDDAAEALDRLAPGAEIAVEFPALVPGWARLPGGTFARAG